MFVALIMMVFCMCHIIFFAVIIFTNLAGSTFDAQLITFQLYERQIGGEEKFDWVSLITTIVYAIWLVDGIIFTSNILQYIVTASTISYYFSTQQTDETIENTLQYQGTHHVRRAICWMLQQLGPIAYLSFESTFLIWFRWLF